MEGTEDQSNDKAPGKSAFVESVHRRDPKATIKGFNQAWSDAGHDGTISDPTFYKVRGQLAKTPEPTSSVSSKPKSSKVTAAAGDQRKARRTSTVTATSKSSELRNPSGVADEVEAGIDDLMYKLKDSGGMPEVEAALRAARRLLDRHGER